MLVSRFVRTPEFLSVAVLMLSAGGAIACDRGSDQRGEAPPPASTVGAAAVCDGSAAEFADVDLHALLATKVNDYCADPNTQPASYGAEASGSMDEVCTELFNGECELYKSFGLRRVTTVRYVKNDGSLSAVDVNVSRFSGIEGALAFYARRVMSEQDPKLLTLRPIAGLPRAALGTAVAYAQVGPFVVEASYSNPEQAPLEVRQGSDAILPNILRPAAKAGSAEVMPPSVVRLPDTGRLPFGLGFETKNAFGVMGMGPAATGFYELDGKRYRVIVAQTDDEHLASDTYRALRRSPGVHVLKDMPFDAFEIHEQTADETIVEWLVGKLATTVVAVTDEPYALLGANQKTREGLCLTREGKLAVLRGVLRVQ